MTIEKHQTWGTRGPLGDGGVVVSSDEEARAVVERCRRDGSDIPDIGLLDGDMCRTVGGRGDEARLRSAEGTRLPVDVGSVLIDGQRHWFTAHLIARNRWWRGRVVAVMNAQWVGRWDVAPKSHPNDGLIDVFDGHLGLDDRLKARRRLLTGTHVPHPDIATSRVATVDLSFTAPVTVWLDGTRVARATSLSITVESDAFTCVV